MAVENILILFLLLVLSGFYSGSETALTSISMVRVEGFLKEGRTGAQSLYALKSNTNRMLIGLLIGNNLVNIGASAMATVLATEAFGDTGPGIAVGILTVFILIFGEITPKTFAARFAAPIALFVAPLQLLFLRLVFPAVWILEKLTDYLQSLSTAQGDPTVTETELVTMAKYGAQEGTIEAREQQMIQRLFSWDGLTAKDVMIPRSKVFMLSGARSINDALPELLAQPYQRIPLHAGKHTFISKVAHVRDVLAEAARGNGDKTLNEVGVEPLFVPKTQPVVDIFDMLRGQKRQLINVVDEFGALEGVLTLEDVLEELVGDIHDEMDRPRDNIRESVPGQIMVDSGVEMQRIQDYFGLEELSGAKPSTPVVRWLLEHARRLPKEGEVFTVDGLTVKVEKATARRIHQMRLSRVGEMPGPGSEPAPSDQPDAGREQTDGSPAGDARPDT